jgi:O-methyltransferase
MGRFVKATDTLMEYLSRVGAREVAAQIHCREDTQKLPMGMMQIAPEQGAFLALLGRLTNARHYVEIGTFTGYSALSVALAMPADGRVVALDVSKEFTDRARGYWKEAGVDGKIDLRLGPGLDALDKMIQSGEGPFDLAFIDADKGGYVDYYEAVLPKLSPRGVIAADNTLFGLDGDGENAQAISRFNEHVLHDDRVEAVLLPFREGVTLIRRR